MWLCYNWVEVCFLHSNVFALLRSPCNLISMVSMFYHVCAQSHHQHKKVSEYGQVIPQSQTAKSDKQKSKLCGKSFMKIRKIVGPNIEPWGRPYRIFANSVKPVSLSMAWWRPSRYESNHLRAEGLNWNNESISISILWSTRSNILRKSRKSVPAISPLSMHSIHLSIIFLLRLFGNYG